MRYAKEVIDLMAAFPGRDFRMSELIHHVSKARKLSLKERSAMHQGIWRVLQQLAESKSVLIRPGRHGNGSYALYRWKPLHDRLEKH